MPVLSIQDKNLKSKLQSLTFEYDVSKKSKTTKGIFSLKESVTLHSDTFEVLSFKLFENGSARICLEDDSVLIEGSKIFSEQIKNLLVSACPPKEKKFDVNEFFIVDTGYGPQLRAKFNKESKSIQGNDESKGIEEKYYFPVKFDKQDSSTLQKKIFGYSLTGHDKFFKETTLKEIFIKNQFLVQLAVSFKNFFLQQTKQISMIGTVSMLRIADCTDRLTTQVSIPIPCIGWTDAITDDDEVEGKEDEKKSVDQKISEPKEKKDKKEKKEDDDFIFSQALIESSSSEEEEEEPQTTTSNKKRKFR